MARPDEDTLGAVDGRVGRGQGSHRGGAEHWGSSPPHLHPRTDGARRARCGEAPSEERSAPSRSGPDPPPQHTHTHTHQLLKLTQPVSACPASLSHSYLTRAPSVHVLSAALSWVTTVLHPISSTTQSTPCFLSIPLQGSSLTNVRTREGFRIRLL